MNRILITAAIAALLGTAAFATPKDDQGATAQRISYALPRTVIRVDLTISRKSHFAGVYAKWAGKIPGLTAGDTDKTTYTLTGVRISASEEPHDRRTFALRSNNLPKPLKMTGQGVISGDWTPSKEQYKSTYIPPIQKPSRMIEAEAAYGIAPGQINDSTISALASMVGECSDAAWRIIIADTDGEYGGNALEGAVNSIKNVQKDILSLFAGADCTTIITTSFFIIPDSKSIQKIPVFRFSSSTGVSSPAHGSGDEYVLTLTGTMGAEPSAEPFSVKSEPSYVSVIVPDTVDASLMLGKETITSTRIPVYQMGIETQYPIYYDN